MLAIGAVLLHAVPACMSSSSDEKLNPQPLPPGDPPPELGDPTGNDSTGGSGGAAPPTPGTSSDAGKSTDADADAASDAAGDP